MRRLTDELSLSGKLETISMMDLRSRPGEVLDAVILGKTFILARSGKPMAVLSKLPGDLAIVVNPNGDLTYELPS